VNPGIFGMGGSGAQQSGLPIGAMMVGPDGEPLITLGDRSVWLRQGSFALASAYPQAAKLEHLRAINLSAAAFGLARAVTSAASNGAGIILGASTGAHATLCRSTDNGVTWGLLEPTGATWHRVYFLGGKFWLINNNDTAITVSESTTGAAGTWTNRTVTVNGAATLVAASADLEWTGTNFVVSVETNTSTLAIHTSPTGATWTSRNAGALNRGRLAAALSSGVVVAPIDGTSYRVSSDHGVTWSNPLNPPFLLGSVIPPVVFTVGNRFYAFGVETSGNMAGIWTTESPAAPASWTQLPLPCSVSLAGGGEHFGQGRHYRTTARDFVYVQGSESFRGYAMRFDAGGNYTVRRVNRASVFPSHAYSLMVVEGGATTQLPANPSVAVLGRAACGWDDFNAVSLGQAIETNSGTPRNLYVRVK
jgi:hypothetical protein